VYIYTTTGWWCLLGPGLRVGPVGLRRGSAAAPRG
jgi:hypothetical protein